jgi:anaerobic ribonucleoside-triphosphate reductase activating protein
MKYLNTEIGFIEFPDEISLLINITNCPFHCKGCHSPELWEDIGYQLNKQKLAELIESNKGITLVGFMGGEPSVINTLAAFIKNEYPNLKVGWYWGGNSIPENINKNNFDYIKVGPYIEPCGSLSNPNTNQRMYEITPNAIIDITHEFQK